MPNESNNANQSNQAETKADNYDKEKDTAQAENKQPASAGNSKTSTEEQQTMKEQKESD